MLTRARACRWCKKKPVFQLCHIVFSSSQFDAAALICKMISLEYLLILAICLPGFAIIFLLLYVYIFNNVESNFIVRFFV